MSAEFEPQPSPRWNPTTKTAVALVLVALTFALVSHFRYLIAPVLIAVLLAYLFHPLGCTVTTRMHLPWKVSITLIYLIFVAILIALITWGGISIANELQNLISFISNLVTNLPTIVTDFLSKPLMIGPFSIDLPHLDLTGVLSWLQGLVQPAITQAANLIGTVASGAASAITWVGFTILISYFISAEADSNGNRPRSRVNYFPTYQADLKRMGTQLSRIWNSFLRGQLIVVALTVLWYTIMLGSIGTNFFFGLAVIAGLARFVPYIGPFIAWVTYFLVGLFQTSNLFGLQPFWFGLLLVALGLISDFVMDNFVSPRVMSNALKVHPAAVLVTVLIAANLFGVIGMLLAAPVLATVKLIMTYVIRKLFDQDPWMDLHTYPQPQPLSEEIRAHWEKVKPVVIRVSNWLKTMYDGIRKKVSALWRRRIQTDKEEN
jgi:predicted PurR-regulated permease PerM